MDPIFGYHAVVERYVPHSANPITGLGAKVERKQIRRKGRRSDIVRAAKLVSGFIQIIEIDAYTEVQYKRTFGWGKM